MCRRRHGRDEHYNYGDIPVSRKPQQSRNGTDIFPDIHLCTDRTFRGNWMHVGVVKVANYALHTERRCTFGETESFQRGEGTSQVAFWQRKNHDIRIVQPPVGNVLNPVLGRPSRCRNVHCLHRVAFGGQSLFGLAYKKLLLAYSGASEGYRVADKENPHAISVFLFTGFRTAESLRIDMHAVSIR